VNIRDVTPDLAATNNPHDNPGALVENIGLNSGAERAGIRLAT
jgi:S1-C subfamily serine protease